MIYHIYIVHLRKKMHAGIMKIMSLPNSYGPLVPIVFFSDMQESSVSLY
jgi:hypothetical protein